MTDYSLIDQPTLLRHIFYPRKDFTSCPRNAFDLFVAVEDRVSISCRFYLGHHEWPWILFFHGNGNDRLKGKDYFKALQRFIEKMGELKFSPTRMRSKGPLNRMK